MNHTKSTKCQYKTIQVKKTIFIWLTWLLSNLTKLINIKNTPKDTWLKCNKSILYKLVQNELVLILKLKSANSHNWFQINKNPVNTLNRQKQLLVYILL